MPDLFRRRLAAGAALALLLLAACRESGGEGEALRERGYNNRGE